MRPLAPVSRSARWAILCTLVLSAFVLHAVFSAEIAVRGARPNLGLCALLTACLFVGSNSGAVMGFALGMLEGSFVAIDLGSFIVTRTLAGFAVGALEERIFRDNAPVAVATVLFGSAVAEGCFFLFAPQPHAARWAVRVLGECLYNGALSLPLYFAVRRLIRARN